jgi:hypothetical protein
MTTWLMILLAVNITNPQDIPGKITLEFTTQQACEQSLQTMRYQLKFNGFKVEGKCIKQYSS